MGPSTLRPENVCACLWSTGDVPLFLAIWRKFSSDFPLLDFQPRWRISILCNFLPKKNVGCHSRDPWILESTYQPTPILHEAPEQDYQSPKTCRCTIKPPSVGIGSRGWRMWGLAICSYRTRFSCLLVESPLPGKSLQGSRKLTEHNSSHSILSLQHSQILKLFA
jgi:hypothetical protein